MSAREWLVEVRYAQDFKVDEETLLTEFGSEWEDAQKRGLDVEDFLRETVEIMRGYLDESPELYRPVFEHYELDITAPRSGAPEGGSG